MYEVYIKLAHTMVKLAQSGHTWANPLNQGKVEITPGVYITLRIDRCHLLDVTSSDGSAIYDLAPDDIKVTFPCRVQAAHIGIDFDFGRTTQATQDTDTARQSKFRDLLLAM